MLFFIIADCSKDVQMKAAGVLSLSGMGRNIGNFHTEILLTERVKFAGIKRSPEGGRRLEGVIERNAGYFNPFYQRVLL